MILSCPSLTTEAQIVELSLSGTAVASVISTSTDNPVLTCPGFARFGPDGALLVADLGRNILYSQLNAVPIFSSIYRLNSTGALLDVFMRHVGRYPSTTQFAVLPVNKLGYPGGLKVVATSYDSRSIINAGVKWGASSRIDVHDYTTKAYLEDLIPPANYSDINENWAAIVPDLGGLHAWVYDAKANSLEKRLLTDMRAPPVASTGTDTLFTGFREGFWTQDGRWICFTLVTTPLAGTNSALGFFDPSTSRAFRIDLYSYLSGGGASVRGAVQYNATAFLVSLRVTNVILLVNVDFSAQTATSISTFLSGSVGQRLNLPGFVAGSLLFKCPASCSHCVSNTFTGQPICLDSCKAFCALTSGSCSVNGTDTIPTCSCGGSPSCITYTFAPTCPIGFCRGTGAVANYTCFQGQCYDLFLPYADPCEDPNLSYFERNGFCLSTWLRWGLPGLPYPFDFGNLNALLSAPALQNGNIDIWFPIIWPNWFTNASSSSSSATSLSSSSATASGGVSGGVVALIVILVILALLGVAFAVWWFMFRDSVPANKSVSIGSVTETDSWSETVEGEEDEEALQRKKTVRSLPKMKPADFYLGVSKARLDFGLEGNQAEVRHPYEDAVLLTNMTERNLSFWVDIPKSTKWRIKASLKEGIVKKLKSETLEFEIRVQCTTRVNTAIKLVIPDVGFVEIPIKLESMLSTRLDWDEIKLDGDPIGDGAFGTVWKATWRGTEVAVKRLKLVHFDDLAEKEFIREIELMNRMRHPNIVEFIGAIQEPDRLCLVTEFVALGSLASQLRKGPIKPVVKVKIMLDTCRGMAFLHASGIIHRDMKPDNLLVVSLAADAPVSVKITDFGTSKTQSSEDSSQMTKGLGTPIYMAPEILENEEYSMPADVYSFAVSAYEIWTQQLPYADFKQAWAIANFVSEGKRLPLPSDLPSDLADVMGRAWAQNTADRPTFSDLVDELKAVRQNNWPDVNIMSPTVEPIVPKPVFEGPDPTLTAVDWDIDADLEPKKPEPSTDKKEPAKKKSSGKKKAHSERTLKKAPE